MQKFGFQPMLNLTLVENSSFKLGLNFFEERPAMVKIAANSFVDCAVLTFLQHQSELSSSDRNKMQAKFNAW